MSRVNDDDEWPLSKRAKANSRSSCPQSGPMAEQYSWLCERIHSSRRVVNALAALAALTALKRCQSTRGRFADECSTAILEK
ncbi:hypothetical protein AX15_001705, partial [Amanita polypyramis BW_CC]